MGRECCSCADFEAYFTKGYCCYIRTDCGYCREHNKVIEKHTPACDKFRGNRTTKSFRHNRFMEEMAGVITKINVITDFIEEYKEKFR